MSEIECAQLHSVLFRHMHSTLQSHGLFALAKHLYIFQNALKRAAMQNFVNFPGIIPPYPRFKGRVRGPEGTEERRKWKGRSGGKEY